MIATISMLVLSNLGMEVEAARRQAVFKFGTTLDPLFKRIEGLRKCKDLKLRQGNREIFDGVFLGEVCYSRISLIFQCP